MRDISIWIKFRGRVPFELKEICRLCLEFYEFMNHIEKITPNLDGFDIERAIAKIFEILAEYVRLMQLNYENDEEKMVSIRRDLQKQLSPFFAVDEDRGHTQYKQDITHAFKDSISRDYVDLHFPIFTANFSGFIDSRIKSSLREAILKSDAYLFEQFFTSTGRKAGIYPEQTADQMFPMMQQPRGYSHAEEIIR